MVTGETLKAYWSKNRLYMTVILLIWALVSYGASLIAGYLNSFVVFGFPFGYYMAAQGSLVVFVLLNLIYSVKMNEIDKKYGLQEEE